MPNLLKELQEVKSSLIKARAEMQACDKEVSRIYHDIETRKFNAYEGYKLSKDLQVVLQRRRAWKVTVENLQSDYDLIGGDKTLHKLEAKRKRSVDRVFKKTKWYSNFSDEAMAILNGDTGGYVNA